MNFDGDNMVLSDNQENLPKMLEELAKVAMADIEYDTPIMKLVKIGLIDKR